MKSNLEEYSKIVETKSKKKLLKTNNRNNTNCPCCYNRGLDNTSNNKY